MFEHDERLARWFADHDQVITLEEADAIGVGAEAVRRRGRAGVLERVQPGVYRSTATHPGFMTALRAAICAVGDDAFVSGHSFARLYGVRGEWSDTPEITVLGGEQHLVLPGVRVRRIDRIEPRDVHRRAGLPVLAPPLGLLTLGASASRWKVGAAVHDMVFLGFTARPQLIDVLKRYGGPGRRGTAAFRAAVHTLDDFGRSTQTEMERRVLDAALDAGFPKPLQQLRVVDGDHRNRRLDLAWPGRMLDVETDGDRWHTSSSDKKAMNVRDRALQAIGYRVERFDSDEVKHDLFGVIKRLRPYFT